jgi:hypothetical protein
MRTLVALVAFLSLTTSVSSQTTSNTLHPVFMVPRASSQLPHSLRVTGPPISTPAAQYCCKTCTVGKACGNTCISREKTCHVGPGCACDG